MRCKTCNTFLAETAIKCPNCKTPLGAGLLSLGGVKTTLDRTVSESLTRAMSASLLERADSMDKLSNEIERISLGSLTTSELQSAITHLEKKNVPDLAELEKKLLIKDEDVALEGIKLAELLDEKANDKDILRKGIIFLKHHRYAEAVDWWRINRERIDAKRQNLQLLLMIMESFTYVLSGDEHKANVIRGEIRKHSLYDKFKMRF